MISIDNKSTIHLSSSTLEIKMNDVYFISRLAYNLMSIECSIDKGFILVFDNKECLEFKGPRQIVNQGVCDPHIRLYCYVVNKPFFSIYAIESSCMKHLWHR